MAERTWKIGMCGTFDVANYGDLLFPLIAEAELTERLGAVKLSLFSYHEKAPADWPLEVESLTTLPEAIRDLDALLIGGGHVIRFDKQIAPGYAPPAPGIHHPTGYWLTPALMALQHDVPLLWNAPGVHGEIPAWAGPLMKIVLAQSRYLSVRDSESRTALEPFANGTPIAVVPDTAFRLPRLNLGGPPSTEFASLGIHSPYIVLQATAELQGFVRFLKNHQDRFRDFQFLALPVSPVVGEQHALIDTDLPGVIRLRDWPGPLLLAELIGRSQAAVGYSYHLFITALTSGVPIFTHQDMSLGKYAGLRHFETIFNLPAQGEPDPDWFLARVGRTAPSASVLATCRPLAEHWDRLASALQADTPPTSPVLNRFWQSLPTVLEDAELTLADSLAALKQEREESHARFADLQRTHRETETAQSLRLQDALAELDATRREASARQDWMETQLAAARAERTERDQQIAEIQGSASWRLTAPLRSGASLFRKPGKRTLIRLERMRQHRLETEPYRWAAISELFDPADGANLAVSYPCDHFKLVASHDGEKEYRYEARALIGMGENTIAYPEELSGVWLALAADLLSPEYREAMARLTGCDLARAPMEVNLFHYPPGGSLGAHKDLPEKIVTHVLYFNRSWNSADGGCLGILRSADAADQVAEILPIVGNSSVIVRSDNSWHAVSRVVNHSAASRRSITVTFYRPGSVSTMWPPGDTTPLHRYQL